jgi:uncharacterized phage protein (TIGR02216 family)
MQFGFGVLHLSADAFWRMTPRELAHAIRAVRGQAPVPIERADFDALMKKFPDSSSFRDAPSSAQTRNPAPSADLDSGFARCARAPE